ncbi:MAG: hypothetical protein AB7P00_20085 [Sandaracinaceae bacterium]
MVAERDGNWSDWVEPLRAEADDIAIILQRMDESSSDLALRVRERVREVAGSGTLCAAALVGGDRWDPDTLGARSSIIRALVAHMTPEAQGQLFLDAGSKAGRGRHAMHALASALSDIVDESVSIVTTRGAVPARRRAA